MGVYDVIHILPLTGIATVFLQKEAQTSSYFLSAGQYFENIVIFCWYHGYAFDIELLYYNYNIMFGY